MIYPAIRKLGIMAAAGLVALALTSAPARASHGHDIIVPLAAFIAIGALAHHHHGHYRYHYHRHHHRPHYRPHGRHSHSHGGYRAPRHNKHHRNW